MNDIAHFRNRNRILLVAMKSVILKIDPSKYVVLHKPQIVRKAIHKFYFKRIN